MPNRNDVLRNSLPGLVLVAASVLPAALSTMPSARGPGAGGAPTAAAKPKAGAAKEFSIPMSNLQEWAGTVVVTVNGVKVEGHSKVHNMDNDCEIHLGGHTSSFQGDPDGLVLEPMNACVQPFPGKPEQNNADWIAFANQVTGKTVNVSGVPRIWPEHLQGGNEPSNPNHAVEIHPLTGVINGSQTFDFAPNVFAGEYRGGVQTSSGQRIVENVSVSVTRVGNEAEISFRGGQIGNFTVLEIVIAKTSITSDGAGSFRMDGEVTLEDGSTATVHIVTVKGSPINDEIEKAKTKRRKNITMEALVLFSLSPQALLDAANQSNGSAVTVEQPIQLILYGEPE